LNCDKAVEISLQDWRSEIYYQYQYATGWIVQGSNPGGGEIFHTCPDWPWGPPSLLYNGYRIFPGGVKSGQGATLTPHPLLVPWSRKSRAIPLLPLRAIRPVQSLSTCTRVHFTFYQYASECKRYVHLW